jgi:transcriptional regulator with XRE-family HTH domain
MDFGEWLHQTRIKRNLDVRALAKKTGIDGSTISRIENIKTQSTLYTAFRICEGLNIPFPTLIYELKGSYPSTQKPLDEVSHQLRENHTKYMLNSNEVVSLKETILITIHDVETFLDFFYADELACKMRLASNMNYIFYYASDVQNQLESSHREIFVAEDIDKLLLSSSFYHFELKYPSSLSDEAILAIYKQEGVMTLTDIGAYTRKVRSQKKVSLEKLEDSAKISSSVLSRLEAGALDRIKLADILTLDEQLEQGWTIIGMYWEACKFQEKFLFRQNRTHNERAASSFAESDDVEFKLASVYITVCRWLYYFSQNNPSSNWNKHLERF